MLEGYMMETVYTTVEEPPTLQQQIAILLQNQLEILRKLEWIEGLLWPILSPMDQRDKQLLGLKVV
jgi:hypothetical protein